METRPKFFALLTAVFILSGCNNNPVAAEQQAILQRVDKSVDDLRPIESGAAGSVCDDLYLRKLYYDEICGSFQKMGESRIASSSDTRIAIRMLLLPTFGRPASVRVEMASPSEGIVTVRQLSRSVLRDNLLLNLLLHSPETATSSPFAGDVRTTFDGATDLDSADVEKILMALNQAKLWGMEFDPYQSSWRYHFRGLLGDNLSSTLLQLVGLDRVI